jgi:2,3-diaminopropionate biosynthesis protein SbnA
MPSNQLIDRVAYAERIIRETPVIRLHEEHLILYAKLEQLNGVGSIKDRPAFWILKRAIERGQVGPNTTIIESSSGNFACALATFCRILGLNFIPVVDPFVSPVYEAFLRTQCENVVKVEEGDDSGGYLKTRLQTVNALLSRYSDAYWPNQYENFDGMAAHYHLTAAEVCRALPDLDYVFIGVSSAGTLAGVSRRLKEHNPAIRIIAVDAEGSVIFGGPPKKRSIPGIGSSISPPLIKEALFDDVVIVNETDTVAACHHLLTRHGLFVGGSTGTVYSAIQRYFANYTARKQPQVLFFCCDRGVAYLHSVFSVDGIHSDKRAEVAAAGSFGLEPVNR